MSDPIKFEVAYVPARLIQGNQMIDRLEWFRRQFAGPLGVKVVHCRWVDNGKAVLASGDGGTGQGKHHLYHTITGECRFAWFDKDGNPVPDDFKGIKFGTLTPEGADDKPED